ncbi:TIR domain-containing protein [Lentzea alba]|uniref:TIR domain-containing protein n=1 Tax=Lentzea alba TaxID=2714351 RepID=UPI0039BFBD8F
MTHDREASDFAYDVCLSYSGEQRVYVQGIALLLRERGIRVFDDDFERADLWGKDLVEHLDHVYRNAAAYCVIFVSASYANSVWTRHERRSAQARALFEEREYILPVRFDDTVIPGLAPTISYVDLRSTTHEDLVDLVVRKVASTDTDRAWPVPVAISSVVHSHNPHVLLGEVALTCRVDELSALATWLTSQTRRMMCLIAPGGQGKSALAWTFFQQTAKNKLWHGLSLETDHYASLSDSLKTFAAKCSKVEIADVDHAIEQIEQHGALIVLDGFEKLYGLSERLEDISSPVHRTIADLRVEALLRRLLNCGSTRLLLTARFAPALTDDPEVARHRERLDLGSIRPEHSPDFWSGLGVGGSVADCATVTAALRGNPLLMRTAARWAVAHGVQDNGAREWLAANPQFVQSMHSRAAFQQAALVEVIRDVTGAEQQMLLALAASRRRLLLDDWLAIGEAFASEDGDRGGLRMAPGSLLALGLVHRRDDGRYETHEITGEAVLRSCSDGDLQLVYRRLDVLYEGGKLYFPAMDHDGMADYDPDVEVESVLDLDHDIGYYLSLLDRELFSDARHVMNNSLFMTLRFRLGDLRSLLSLTAAFRAARTAATGQVDHSFSFRQGEIAVFDGRPDEALKLLDPDPADPSPARLRAEALAQQQDFTDAYASAQHACYAALSVSTLIEEADYTSFQMLGAKHATDSAEAMIEFALTLRTLSRVLRGFGRVRAATLAALAAVTLVHRSGQPGISSMVHEELGHCALDAGMVDQARWCADRAADGAAEMKVAEHLVNVGFLNLRIHAEQGDLAYLAENVTTMATTAARLGFGVVAQECMAIAERFGLDDAWLLQSCTWRYPSRPTRPTAASHHLYDELTELRDTHPPGRWIELTLLRRLASPRSSWPEPVRHVFDTVLGDVAGCLTALRSDIGADRGSNGFLSMLAEDSSDVQALSELAAAFPEGGDEVVYTCALAGIQHLPRSDELRRCLLRSAVRPEQLETALAALGQVADAQVAPGAVTFDMANALREAGHHLQAVLIANAGHIADHSMMWRSGSPIANIVGAGLDMLKLGVEPEGVLTAVTDALAGRPLIHEPWDEPPRLLKHVGGAKDSDQHAYSSPANAMRQMNVERMTWNRGAVQPGTAEHVAISALAAHLGLSMARGVKVSGELRTELAADLSLIRGHDEAVRQLIRHVSE